MCHLPLYDRARTNFFTGTSLLFKLWALFLLNTYSVLRKLRTSDLFCNYYLFAMAVILYCFDAKQLMVDGVNGRHGQVVEKDVELAKKKGQGLVWSLHPSTGERNVMENPYKQKHALNYVLVS